MSKTLKEILNLPLSGLMAGDFQIFCTIGFVDIVQYHEESTDFRKKTRNLFDGVCSFHCKEWSSVFCAKGANAKIFTLPIFQWIGTTHFLAAI